jgi:hypothetical protein
MGSVAFKHRLHARHRDSKNSVYVSYQSASGTGIAVLDTANKNIYIGDNTSGRQHQRRDRRSQVPVRYVRVQHLERACGLERGSKASPSTVLQQLRKTAR